MIKNASFLCFHPTPIDHCTAIFLAVAPEIKIIHPFDLSLLESPLHTKGLDEAIATKIDHLKHMCSRLANLDGHDAFFSAENSFSIPRLTYLLRTAPCRGCIKMVEYDECTRSALENFLIVKITGQQ